MNLDYTAYKNLHTLVQNLDRHPEGSPQRQLLVNALGDVPAILDWLREQDRKLYAPIWFKQEMPGYWLIGQGDPVPIPEPARPLAGIEIAKGGRVGRWSLSPARGSDPRHTGR